MDDFSHVTLCFATPRSRTHWLAWLYGHAIETWHDAMQHCEHPRDLKGMIEARRKPNTRLFIADTAAILFHNALCDALPGVRRLYVRRPAHEVALSLKAQTGFLHTHQAHNLYDRVTEASRTGIIGSLADYHALNTVSALWWHGITGTPRPESPGWWRDKFATVIDVPMRDQPADELRRQSLMQHAE